MSIRDLIFKHCLDNNAISKGLAIYQKGEVKNLQQTINDDSISYHAHILNQKAEISLKEEALIHFFCTCQPDKGLCQHGVALLRALNDTLTPTHQVSKKELELAHELMETYHQQQASSFRSFFIISFLSLILTRIPCILIFLLRLISMASAMSSSPCKIFIKPYIIKQHLPLVKAQPSAPIQSIFHQAANFISTSLKPTVA